MKHIKQTFSKTKLALSLSGALLLTACGGTDQDDGTASTFEQVLSGRAIDGYLARATVFADSNNNGTRDPWEVFAFTDNDGYYSYNPLTQTNYCANDASAQEAQYCLRINTKYTNVVIRVDGGYDILTGEPFLGQMSRRVNLESQTETTDILVSPITSLLTNVETQTDQDTLLNSLGIQASDVNVDYLNTDGAGAINTHLLNTSLKIHKAVAILSDRLTDTYDEIGEDFGTPNDASIMVYPSLASQIITSQSDLNSALTDRNLLTNVMDSAELQLRKVYEQKEFDLPTNLDSISTAIQRSIDIVTQVPNVVDRLIDVTNFNFTQTDAIGSSKAIETLVIKSVNEGSSVDTSIDNVINFFDIDNNDDPFEAKTLVDTLLANLALDNADLNGLSQRSFSGSDIDSVEDIIRISTLPSDSSPFSAIGGFTLKVSDLDLGYGPDKHQDSEVEFYFDGTNTDLDGTFVACVKFIEDANVNTGTIGDGSVRGEVINGFWSALGATNTKQETYSVLLTLSILGSTYQAILKPSGNATIDNIDYQVMRFDRSNNKISLFHSIDGITQTTSIPKTNAECEARLPSRIDL